MSLFEEEPGAPSEPLPAFKPNPTAYKDIIVDTEFTNVGTILTAIEGMSWQTTWLSGIYNRDNAVSTLQTSRLEINQQFKRIYNYELKVTVPLPVNPEFDPSNQEFTVRGEANLYPGMRPSLGDMFIASLLDGRVGLFQVSAPPEQRSIYLQTTYRIEYVLREFMTTERAKEIEDKVIEDYYFNKSFLDSGINPVITESSQKEYDKLKTSREGIPVYYLTKFFNKEFSSLIIPGQGSRVIYDPFLNSFISAIWSAENLGLFTGMDFLNVMDGSVREFRTVLNALLESSEPMMDLVETKIPVVATATFLADPYLRGVRYMSVPNVIYPNAESNYLAGYAETKLKVAPLVNGARRAQRVRFTLNQLYPTGNLIPNENGSSGNTSIKDISIDDYYIFSEDFYGRRQEGLSNLESLVWQALNNKSIPAPLLISLFDEARGWDDLNQFYYIPILCALIPSALRGLSG